MEASASNSESQTLSQLFENGTLLHRKLEESSLGMNSNEFQDDLTKAISALEKATEMVNDLSLFSSNENFEEISTADIKYLMLPAVLGSLVLKITTRERTEVLNISEVYFKDFLGRCKCYGLTDAKIPQSQEDETVCLSENALAKVGPQTSLKALEDAAVQRRNKIDQFLKQKELKQIQERLKRRLDAGELEDEAIREYYSTLLQSWILLALEELESIQKERPVLEYMLSVKSRQNQTESKPKPNRQPLKPIIITRNELQKQVYGLGYPSRPVMTVDEFYAKRYPEHKDGPQIDAAAALSMQYMAEDPDRTKKELELEAAEKEVLDEKEDPVTIIRDRNWDEWKDDHRRGWGNRKNMG